MKQEIANVYPDRGCFFCGDENPSGLKLRFYMDDETGEVSTEYLAAKPFGGLGNILHGGIQSGLFDEIMGWTAHTLTGQMGVTAELNIRFLQPVYLGHNLVVTCRMLGRDASKVRLQAQIVAAGGAVCSSATGVYHLLTPDRFERLVYGT